MNLAVPRDLILTKLAGGLPGLSSEMGAVLAQAGAICFEDQSHQQGVELQVNGALTGRYRAYWESVTDQMVRTWKDEEYATEHAACGIALLLICDLTEYTIISRAQKGTGIDYWLGQDDGDEYSIFQKKARLEVSGIRNGDHSEIRSRIRSKLQQIRQSHRSGLPAYVVIVEFSMPHSEVVRSEQHSRTT